MARKLRRVHAGNPLFTNASINRNRAVKCFEAGMTPDDIASAWPEVFKATTEHGRRVLGQRYDYELADGSGRKETNRLITESSMREVIAAFKARHA